MQIALPSPTPEAASDASHDARTGRDTRHQAILDTLIDQGAAIAARIAAAATAASTPDSALPEAATAFDRITRCVRRTIALSRHIAAHPTQATTPDRTKARTRIIRAVEDSIHRQVRVEGGDKDALDREFAERLDDPALEFDFEGRDIEAVIQEICRDLGLSERPGARIWRRRTPTDIEHLRTRAAAPPTPHQKPSTDP